ncbi:hypothetical protein BBJ66_20110 [Rhizobium sp. RSm-3]|nr:hypothetical protein BBJ66_20110 [Rhizobium sp. RSm-3]
MEGRLRRRDHFERRHIVAVHGHDQIEIPEIAGADSAGALPGYIDTVAFRGGDRPPVRLLAFMPAAGAGGIDRETAGQTCLGDEMAENSLRERRAAYIAHTDEEDIDRRHRRPVGR